MLILTTSSSRAAILSKILSGGGLHDTLLSLGVLCLSLQCRENGLGVSGARS